MMVPRQAMAPGAGARMQVPPANGPQQPRVSEFLRGISLEYSFQELTTATKSWNLTRRLGSGSYGAVYKGEMEDGSEVAIKMIDLSALVGQGQTADMAGFEEEVQTLSKFRHPNLVTLLGWGKHAQCRYLVYELMTGGDVFERLLKSRKREQAIPFQWYERISACLDAATGLSHMHNSKPKAFHRDIKSANILLDRHGTAKMADFGLSCTSTGGAHVKVKTISGTPGYACPIYSRTGRVTEGSEVYSFGMVILELLTALPPATADSRKPGGISYQIEEKLAPGNPGALDRCVAALDATASWPRALAEELAALSLRCVNASDESQRPRFVEVVRSLRAMSEKFPGPQLVPSSMQGSDSGARTLVVPGGGYGGSSNPPSPESRGCGSSSSFTLELVSAADIEVASLPMDFRRLSLVPSLGEVNGRFTAPVGRQHQQELFEAWLPNLELRSCISRLAFEVSWLPGGSDTQIVARGNNPVTLADRTLTRGQSMPLAVGSEVGFPYSHTGELSLFLKLRFVAAPRPAAAREAASAPTAALGGCGMALEAAAGGSGRWVLQCTFVEGLSPEELQSLPTSAREFVVEANAQLVLGRQHQPKEFEVLLSKAPACMSFISRSHVQLEAQGGVLAASNVSSNPVYVDGEPLAKGEFRNLVQSQVISFARLEGSTHALFISFEVSRLPR
eukprot:TRINITY_DN18784_c0_g1_i1.p1 TRINITY_DN18784_c0_g1~~TRINITY_DN18784_c0_g1_i1.p1  ORF type:complete len:678 (+),score=133.79 TRINITY_DN18784_c0_g1_i1:54-2087(+)